MEDPQGANDADEAGQRVDEAEAAIGVQDVGNGRGICSRITAHTFELAFGAFLRVDTNQSSLSALGVVDDGDDPMALCSICSRRADAEGTLAHAAAELHCACKPITLVKCKKISLACRREVCWLHMLRRLAEASTLQPCWASNDGQQATNEARFWEGGG
jgi:hypothetical protein